MIPALMSALTRDPTPVVTAFLYRRGKVLLLRRSPRVGSYPGKWAGVSGYLERPPLSQARRELAEEVRVRPREAALCGMGVPLRVDDRAGRRAWVVFPFLFRLRQGVQPRLDWESAGSQWVRPEELCDFDTVPGLAEALARVWPPWGSAGFWREMEAIATNTTEGATELALRGLRAVGRLRPELRRRGLAAFSALHPSMGVFPHLAARAHRRSGRLDALAQRLERATTRAARGAARALRPCRTVLTHSASRAVRETLLRWGRADGEVVVTESRPLREGVALARELVEAGLRVRLITEAQIGLFVPRCEAVLVGADAITDRELVNKAGTRLAVLAAREAGVPCCAVAQTFKICPPGWPLILTPQDPSDVGRLARARVSNIAFDATPTAWFAGIYGERGLLGPAEIAAVQAALLAPLAAEPE